MPNSPNSPTFYDIEDYDTGKKYRVEAYEDGTTYDEAVNWFSTLPESERAGYEVKGVNSSRPATASSAPATAPAAPAAAPQANSPPLPEGAVVGDEGMPAPQMPAYNPLSMQGRNQIAKLGQGMDASFVLGPSPIPDEMQAEYQARLPGTMKNGLFVPEEYAKMRTELDVANGFGNTGYAEYLAWASSTNERLRKGGVTIGSTLPRPGSTVAEEREADSPFVTGVKSAIVSSPGALAGTVAGAKAASKTPGPPIAKAAAALAVGVPVAFGAQSAAEYGYSLIPSQMDALGLSAEQRALNAQENPLSDLTGQILAGGRPTLRAGLAERAVSGGVEASVEAAQQLILDGKIDLAKVGTVGLVSAIATKPWIDMETSVAHRPDFSGIERGDLVTYDAPTIRALALTDLANKSAEEVLSQGVAAIADTPENRRIVEGAKAFVEAGDYTSAAAVMADLEVKKTNGLDQQTAERLVNDAMANWANAPVTRVHASAEDAGLTVPEGAMGIFNKDTGEVDIFADQLVDELDATAVVFHEVLGHAGLSWQFQDELDDLLLNLYRNGHPDFKKAVDDWNVAHKGEYDSIADPDRRLAASIEEVLAETSEKGPIYASTMDVIKNKIKDFARRAGAEQLQYSEREIKSILATGHDNIINGGDRALGLGGVRYTFAGAGAETADYNAFGEAIKLPQDTQRQRDASKRMTGWFKGPDSQWRFEISDHDMTIDQAKFDALAAELSNAGRVSIAKIPIDEIVDHPRLFEAYPELREIEFSVKRYPFDFDGSVNGWFEPRNNRLFITPNNKNPRKTIAHELQHAVQEIEGFASGGSPKTAVSKIPDDRLSEIAETTSKYLARLARSLEIKGKAFDNATNDPLFQEYAEAKSREMDAYRLMAAERDKGDTAVLEVFKGEYEKAVDETYEVLKALREKLGVPIQDAANSDELYQILRHVERHPEDRLNELTKIVEEFVETDMAAKALRESALDEDWDAVRKELGRINAVSNQAYQSLFGEVEARDVEYRLNMFPEERNMVSPYSSEGLVKPDEYVFDFGEDVNSQSLRFARRVPRNPGYDRRTQQFYDKHLSPKMADNLHGIVSRLDPGVRISDEDTIAEALEMGLDVKGAIERGAIPDNSAYVVALGDLLKDTGNRVVELSRFLRDQTKGTAEDEAKLVKALLDHAEVRTIFDKSRSNLGRSLRALQVKIADYGEDFSGVVDELNAYELGDGTALNSENIRNMARRIAAANNPGAQLQKEVDKFDTNWYQFAMSMYYNGLLGTMTTVGWTGPIGNATNFTREMLSDTLGLIPSVIRGKISPDKERLLVQEVGMRWKGVATALLNPETYKSVVREFTAPAGSRTRNRWQSQQIRHLPTSMVLEWGTRGLQAGDAFFRSIIETSNMMGLATRQAARELKIRNPNEAFGADADAINARVAEIMAAPDVDLLRQVQAAGDDPISLAQLPQAAKAEQKRAQNQARLKASARSAADVTLLQEQLTGGWKLAAAPAKIPVIGPIMMPIVTTIVNNLRRGTAELTGIPSFVRLASGKLDGANVDRELGKLLVAAGVTGFAFSMAEEGAITGLGPSDPRERAEWLKYNKPRSIKIGDEWYSYEGVDPFATYLTIMADTVQNTKRKNALGSKRGKDALTDIGWNMTNAFVNSTVNNSWVSSLRSAAASDEHMVENILLGTAAIGRTPFVSEIEEKTDEFARDTAGEDFFERYQNRVQARDPGLLTNEGREGLPVRVNTLGRATPRTRTIERDPVINELGRLFDATGVIIVGDFQRRRKGVYIDSDVYNQVNAIAGPVIYQRVTAFMKRPEYAKLPDERKARELQKISSDVREHFGKLMDVKMIQRDPENLKKMQTPLKQARMLPMLNEGSEEN